MELSTSPKDQIIAKELDSYSRFRRVLRRPDQLALDDLFAAARQHAGLAQFAPHALPFEIMLLTMLLEEHKEVRKLNAHLEAARIAHLYDRPPGAPRPPTANTIPGSVDPGIGFDDDPNHL